MSADVTLRSRIVLDACLEYFNKNPDALAKFLAVLRRKSPYSLRLVDWLITNYSRRYALPIRATCNGCVVPLDVYSEYRRHLSVFTKKHFDPFARRNRILLRTEGTTQVTTIAQVNFFKWWFARGIDAYAMELKATIEEDMRSPKNKTKPAVSILHVGTFTMKF